MLLTSAIGASVSIIDQAYDIKNLDKYLDFLHIMCYDYGGAWDRKITANAPLTSDGPLNVQFTIEHLIKMGASPSKIVMGVPFYGRTFITNMEGNFEDPSTEIGFTGIYTRENGFMGYNEICDLLSNRTSGWKRSWDNNTSQGVARFKEPLKEETRVAIYDSSRSVANKLRYAMRADLAGAMVWSVDTDDFRGDCDNDDDTYADFIAGTRPGVVLTIPKRYNSNYPLLRTINEATVIALEEIKLEAAIKDQDADNEIPHGVEPENDKGTAVRSSTVCASVLIVALVSHICRT